MTDDEHTEEFVRFEWQTPKDKSDLRVHVVAEFGEARIHLDFTDDGAKGTSDLQKVVGTMPMILKHVRNERMIDHEMEGVEQDLLDLLGDGEAE